MHTFAPALLALFVALANACAPAGDSPRCEPMDVSAQTLELTGEGTCRVPQFATLAQFYCTGERSLEVETSADGCGATVRFSCARGPVWTMALYQETDDTLSGEVEVRGDDCTWRGQARATIKRGAL